MNLNQIILLKTSVIEIKHGYPYRSSDSILIQLLTEFWFKMSLIWNWDESKACESQSHLYW